MYELLSFLKTELKSREEDCSTRALYYSRITSYGKKSLLYL
ncbi:hypothetical protein T08_15515 [Trichinella sp. T8]|nr:hypothetical protein T08_15515 [Trichinella sp. T8]